MSPPAIVKIDTHPNKQTLLLAIYFLVGDQGRLTFERFGLLVSVRFTE